jgi:hypothetical protein
MGITNYHSRTIMKKIITIHFCLLILVGYRVSAQDKPAAEKYGNTLNLGLGCGYYGYVGYATPIIAANYEFDLVRNFTLAPFISIYTFQNRNNTYREVVMPVGIKSSYYFDELLHANPNWGFYAAASIGFSYRTIAWGSHYYGDRNTYQMGSPLYLALHVGAEYHLNQKIGLFLDLSTGMSTFGVAVHF